MLGASSFTKGSIRKYFFYDFIQAIYWGWILTKLKVGQHLSDLFVGINSIGNIILSRAVKLIFISYLVFKSKIGFIDWSGLPERSLCSINEVN